MIERLLAADAALERDELEVAERLFGQVAQADERNAIAVVGLGRVALRRGDREGAAERMREALAIDPDEAAARRLLGELEGTAARAEIAPEPEPVATAEAAVGAPERTVAPEPTVAAPGPMAASVGVPIPEPETVDRRPSLLDRIRRWLGLGRGR